MTAKMTGPGAAGGLDEALTARLTTVGRLDDADIPLGSVALVLAGIARPGVPLDRYESHLAELGAAVAESRRGFRGAIDVEAAGRLLAHVMAVDFGYHGDLDTYDDLQNANLIRVIDRRRGLPVALGILYAEAARAQGWQLAGLNFPGHFLVRLTVGGDRRVLDPFNAGRILDAAAMRGLLTAAEGPSATLRPEHYATIGNREVLLRLQNNVKLRHVRSGALAEALQVLDAMVLIAPAMAWHWRERGLLHERLGHPSAAIADLEHFRTLAQRQGHDARWQGETAARIADIRRTLN